MLLVVCQLSRDVISYKNSRCDCYVSIGLTTQLKLVYEMCGHFDFIFVIYSLLRRKRSVA